MTQFSRIERVHFNETGKRKKNHFFNDQEEKKNLVTTMSSIDTFYKHDGEYLEAIGKSLHTINLELTNAYLSRLEKLKIEKQESSETTAQIEEQQSEGEDSSAMKEGLHLLSSANRLFFEVALNQISTSIITIHNRGSVTVHFEWVREKKPNHLNVSIYN
jgi:hypothetical protein